MARVAMVVFALSLAVGLAVASAQGAAPLTVPLKGMQDEGKFVLYYNEESVAHGDFLWEPSGRVTSNYKMTMGGLNVSVSIHITPGADGQWASMAIDSPQGRVDVTREGTKARIAAGDKVSTVELRPGMVLFENFTPCLMSQALLAYDKGGGKQTFPVFIVPHVVMDGSLERLQTTTRSIGGKPQQFTIYRYGLPGLDVTVWVDEARRVCYADIPAQHCAYVREGYDVLRLPAISDPKLSQAKYDVTLDDDVAVPMRDGVKLSTDIYRPAAAGTHPVVLVRTPYKKEMSELEGKFYARRGYVCAIQDCRGRFASEGVWDPFFAEPADGYDTIEWLAAQPWSNGKVGMVGGSYLGWVQWWAAREAPPHLVTIIPNVAPPDPYFNIPYEYGAFFLLGAIWWADVLEQEATADLTGKTMQAIGEKKYARLLRHLPVVELDQIVLGKQNPYWRQWIEHPDNDAYWARASFLDSLGAVDIPVFHQSGWFDGDGIGSKLNYLAMAKHGHPHQKLTLGPWGHTAAATRLGPLETDFGPSAITDLERAYLRWLDRWLKGVDNGIDREPLVSLFVMGTDKWVTGKTYPLAGTELTKFYLASEAGANTSAGNGWLTTALPTCAASDTYLYDPGDPTPDPNFYFDPADTLEPAAGDSTALGASAAPAVKEVSVEQLRAKAYSYYAQVDRTRQDILVYDTEPLAGPLTFAGPISAVLYAGTSAADTDWFMRLSKVNASGQVFPLTHGVIRARYRNSFSTPAPVTPGEIYEYHLDLWQTGITIPQGERLRVEVASASFPTFSRNLNTGGHNETETSYVAATQTIYHDAAHPSHIVLPVLKNPVFKDSID